MGEPPLRLIIDAPAGGRWNMQRDLELLEMVCSGGSAGAVRLYGFAPPCLSLGRLQSDADVDRAACWRDGVEVVRRPTGGRAVLHDQEVTYSVTCSVRDPLLGGTVMESCAAIHAAVALGLSQLGISTHPRSPAGDERDVARRRSTRPDCFAAAAAHELLDRDGRKLVGSAQARRGGGLLQHGSVLLEPPRAGGYLLGVRASPARTGGVRGLLGRPVTAEELAAALARGFVTRLSERLSAAAIDPGPRSGRV